LPRPREGAGDLFAVSKIVLPRVMSDRERELLKEMAAASDFDPRAGLSGDPDHAN